MKQFEIYLYIIDKIFKRSDKMKDIIEGNKIEWEEDYLNNMVEYVNNNYESL